MFRSEKTHPEMPRPQDIYAETNKCSCNIDPTQQNNEKPMPIVPLAEARRFMVDCLKAAGASVELANIHADSLIDADYRGNFTYGMNRLELFCKYLKSRRLNGKEKPQLLKETSTCGVVDGQNTFGSVVGNFCMEIAIKKAKTCGIAIVVARNSTPYGCSAYYTEQAVKANMIGFACSNETPIQIVPRAKEAVFGINPIAFAAPISLTDLFSLDMTTAATSVAKIERMADEGKQLPIGWATNECGKPETNPEMALNSGRLVPLGSFENQGVYKGYGLAMMVDVLAGVLSGANYGPKVPVWNRLGENEIMNVGHCFIVINPEAFAPGFHDKLKWLAGYIRNLEPIDPKYPVCIPGDKEKQFKAKTMNAGGVRYNKRIMGQCMRLAQEFKVRDMLEERPCL